MTPEEVAQFVLSDCQDPELKKKAAAEIDAYFEEQLKDPEVKAEWDASIKRFADRIDAQAARVYDDLFGAKSSQEREP